MKVAGVFGGLGSQMFKYAFYLNLKAQTQEKCYIDTSFFVTGSAWNGYELERIFQINAPDWKDELDQAALKRLELKQTDYQDEVLYAMQKRCGKVSFLCLGSVFGTFCDNKFSRFRFRCYKAYVYRVRMWLTARHLIHNEIRKKYLADGSNVYFEEFSHNSDLYFRGGGKCNIKKAFTFPQLTGRRNLETAARMKQGASVALHVRRTDHMYDNGKLFRSGYYKKAVAYIKTHTTERLQFYLFSDDMDWCRNHPGQLGLDAGDTVYFIDWNRGEYSYVDMQLMTFCQHHVIPVSSFSWWGYYLSDRENKIVCAPKGYWLDVRYHF